MLSGRTRLLGVIGHPIEHSLSPRMHNAAFAASGMDYVYVPMDVRPGDLPAAVRGMAALGFRGFNVTMPHKEGIIPLLDELDEAARISGAVNTVAVQDGKLLGLNTDGSGFLEACAEAGVGFAGKRVLMLGAGGAAAAVAVAVLGEGVGELRIVNRSAGRAERLRDRLREAYPEAEVRAYPVGALGEAADRPDVIFNATYLGMNEGDPPPIPAGYLDGVEAVCDAVYGPGSRPGSETPLIREARRRGARTVPGGRMLLYQGVQAQRVWTGREPDVGAMDDALS